MKMMMKKALVSLGVLTALSMSGCSSSDGNSTSQIESAPQYAPAGWYMKTSVSATDPATSTVYSHKTAGVFGELDGSVEGKDRHDIPGYGSAIFQVVFVQTTWGSANGDYFSDYRTFSSDHDKQVWTFQVKNEQSVHLEDANITIMLDGVYDVLSLEEDGRIKYKEELSSDNSKKEAIKLVDVDTQIVYTYAELQNAQLNMDGLNIRTFRWVMGDVDGSDTAALASSTNRSAARSSATGFVFKEDPAVEEMFGTN